MSSTFEPNPNIVVFLGDGTQIYGNLPTDPQNPPQPPLIIKSIGDFAVFSSEYTDLRDRVKITAGDVGSSVYSELGCDDTLYGNVYSKGSMFLRERSLIYGEAAASNNIIEQNDVHIQKNSRSYALIDFPVLETPIITYGETNVEVPPRTSYTLVPGQYNTFHIYDDVELTIEPGEYSFRELILEPNVNIYVNITNDDQITLLIKDKCSIGNGTSMTLPGGLPIPSPFKICIKSAQTSEFYIGTESNITGLLYAPESEVHIYSRSNISGSIYAKRIIIEPDVQVCKPPTLFHISHSEGALAPPFNPIHFNYTAFVSDATSTLKVITEVQSGQTVTINGNDPSYPVNLSGTVTDIEIQLAQIEGCGITSYNLEVTQTPSFQIFVDPNSPCTPGTEDGLTWQTAWKNIEDALSVSVLDGKQISIHEGVYIPTERTDPADPRTSTFIVPCGTEIVGGFLGTETDGKPLGSPYNTILSGDVNDDDDNCTNWPPNTSELQYIDDNVYHVVTIDGGISCSDSRISNLTINRGYANGNELNSMGGGILIKTGNAKLEFVRIINNLSNSNGAGIYVQETGNLSSIRRCLVQENFCATGIGAGLYFYSRHYVLIDGSIFNNNITAGTSQSDGGSAIYTKSSSIDMVNCVVVQNESSSDNASIINDASIINITNCTFAFNYSNGVASITNTGGGVTNIKNSILWNNYAKDEVSGTNIFVNYSCITNGYNGNNNISTNPFFVDQVNMTGQNGFWGDNDDGLRLTENSICRQAGDNQNAPDFDIISNERDKSSGSLVDLGAYAYVYANDDGVLGKFTNGSFNPSAYFDVVDEVNSSNEIISAIESGYYHIIEAELPKNKYTDKKNEVKIQVFGLDASENQIGNKIEVILYRVVSTQKFRSYVNQNSSTYGKPIFFVKNIPGNNSGGGEHYLSYLIKAEETGKIKMTLNKDQFN